MGRENVINVNSWLLSLSLVVELIFNSHGQIGCVRIHIF